jgi:fructosamine-3-kinase
VRTPPTSARATGDRRLPGEEFVKQRPGAPAGFFEVEAAGLAWLAAAEAGGGVRVARVREVGPGRLVLERVATAPPTEAAARSFGAALAATHRSGAPWFGCPPPGWRGAGFIGDAPLSFVRDAGREPGAGSTWGPFFARHRLAPYLRLAHDAGALDTVDVRVLEAVCGRLDRSDAELAGDPAEPPSRLHGDLWAGNVLWSGTGSGGGVGGAVLVDPAAHGGSRESDLAMLALFGLPYLDAVLDAYDDAWPLAPGWRDRVGLHQLFPLLVHAVLFGSGYGAQAVAVARRYA